MPSIYTLSLFWLHVGGLRSGYFSLPLISRQGLHSNVDMTYDTVCMPSGINNVDGPYNILKSLGDFVNAIWAVVPPPEKFLSQFSNPCWYMDIHISQPMQRFFRSRENVTNSTASKIMRDLFQIHTPNSTEINFGCIPKVYFIGFPRSGSTQLYNMLINHPLIQGGINKEPHWWTRSKYEEKFPYNVISVFRYLSHYITPSQHLLKHPKALLIDGSQSTIWDTRITNNWCVLPSLITNIVPEAKFIVLMRDPVQRLLSDAKYLFEEHWWSVMKNGSIPPTYLSNATKVFLENAQIEIQTFQRCLKSYSLETCTHLSLNGNKEVSNKCGRVRLGISLYHVHIRQWLNVISRKQFLFLRTDDLEQDPKGTLKRVWMFLGVPDQREKDLNDFIFDRLNSSKHKNTLNGNITEIFEFLTRFFQPHNDKLAYLLKDSKFSWRTSRTII